MWLVSRYSKCGSWASSRITWEFIRSAESRPPPQTHGNRISVATLFPGRCYPLPVGEPGEPEEHYTRSISPLMSMSKAVLTDSLRSH